MYKDDLHHCWDGLIDQDTAEIYRRYDRRRRIASKPALIVIDLYNCAYEGGDRPVSELVETAPSSCGENAWRAIGPTKALLAQCRSAGIPVIYCTKDNFTRVGGSSLNATNRAVYSAQANNYTIIDAFAPTENDLVIYKSRASIFYGTPLQAHLTRLNVNGLIVIGQSTSGCVRASVVDGYSHGYHVTVVEDCCFDRALLPHQVSLFDLHAKYADVMRLGVALEMLQSRQDA